MQHELLVRRDQGLGIIKAAAQTAKQYFMDIDKLVIEAKGKQDLVSDADKGVETQIRDALAKAFPDDGIVGEEHGRSESTSGYTWVIDPIDGTSSFVVGMPGWCVVLGCVLEEQVVLSLIIDPIADETFVAVKGQGATLNDRPLSVSSAESVDEGSIAVGYSARIPTEPTLAVLTEITRAGGIYYRCGSGALMLCYVAAGRLLGYCEQHMWAWDCVAALHIIEEAGGMVEQYDVKSMLLSGGRVVTACPGVYPQLLGMCDEVNLE